MYVFFREEREIKKKKKRKAFFFTALSGNCISIIKEKKKIIKRNDYRLRPAVARCLGLCIAHKI